MKKDSKVAIESRRMVKGQRGSIIPKPSSRSRSSAKKAVNVKSAKVSAAKKTIKPV